MTSSAAPPGTPASTTRPPRSTPDLVATVGLLLLAVALALVATVAVAGLVMGVSSCTEETCALLGVVGGAAVAVAGPWAGVLGLGTWAVVRSVRRRRAWWVALAAVLSVPALWFGGGALMWLAAGGASG
jgi:hypothetical protein